MERKTLFIVGGVSVAVLAAYLYMRSRSASGPDTSADAGGSLDAGQLLFTPPAPLAAPGAGNWDSTNVPDVATMPGASGQSALTTAMQSQDAARLELGKATLLSQLAGAILANTPSSQIDQLAVTFGADGGLNIKNTRPAAPAVRYVNAWSSADANGVQYWTDRAGATATQQNNAIAIKASDGTTYTGDDVRTWGAAMEAAGNYSGIYDALKAKGVSLDSYDLLTGHAAGQFSTDRAEAWAIANGKTVF